MKQNRKDFKKLCSFSIVFALSLLIVMSSSYNMSTNAVYKYEYKKGDVYRFTTETSTTAKTEEGTATESYSYAATFKIKDIDEDEAGYRIKVDVIIATSSSAGFIIQEVTVEGDPKPFTSGISPDEHMEMPMFITTDWEDRGDEWKDYVDNLGDNKGWMITDYTKSEGVFTVDIEFDVSDDDSSIDYDDDGDYDSYTGTASGRIEYNDHGVLSSYSRQQSIEFNKQNSFTDSVKVYRGKAGLELGAILPYILMAVIGIVALVIGFAIGSRKARVRKPTVPTAPPETERKEPQKPET